jgi:hypothetical protein
MSDKRFAAFVAAANNLPAFGHCRGRRQGRECRRLRKPGLLASDGFLTVQGECSAAGRFKASGPLLE